MRTSVCVAALLCLMCGGDVRGAKAVLKAQRYAHPGDLVSVDASSSDGIGFLYNVWPQVEGRDKPRPSADGRSCEIPTYPGVYLIQLIVCDGNGGIDNTFHTLTVSGTPPSPIPTPTPPPFPSPVPIPGPTPTPTPGPPDPSPGPAPAPTPGPPADRFQVGRDVYAWAAAVNSSKRAQEAAAIAAAFAGVAQQIRAGQLTTPLQYSKALVAANEAAINGDAVIWQPVGEKIVARVQELWKQRQLQSSSDWAELFEAIAAALRTVK